MTGIDHTDQVPPEPAKPILASALLDLEMEQRRRFVRNGAPERIRTGCGGVDEILGGGFERGIVVGISAEGGEGSLLSIHTLASILLSHLPASARPRTPRSNPIAIIIDTIGSFPLPLLAKVLRSRITSSRATSVQADQGTNAEEEKSVDADVQRCLEMVALSRVFDIQGLWEVSGEVGHAAPLPEPDSSQPRPTQEIIDSEEEESPITNPDLRSSSLEEDSGTEIIIIDNLTHIINELFSRKEKGDAHTLLASLSQTIYTLTQTQNILTLLHNTTTPSKPAYQSIHQPHLAQQQQQQSPLHLQANPQPSSLFPSNPSKPALGQIFAQFPTLHLSLTPLPKTQSSAEKLYAHTTPDGVPLPHRSIHYCTVIEILKDETPNLHPTTELNATRGRKFGWREQRWTAVETSLDGLSLVPAFPGEDNAMRGTGPKPHW